MQPCRLPTGIPTLQVPSSLLNSTQLIHTGCQHTFTNLSLGAALLGVSPPCILCLQITCILFKFIVILPHLLIFCLPVTTTSQTRQDAYIRLHNRTQCSFAVASSLINPPLFLCQPPHTSPPSPLTKLTTTFSGPHSSHSTLPSQSISQTDNTAFTLALRQNNITSASIEADSHFRL